MLEQGMTAEAVHYMKQESSNVAMDGYYSIQVLQGNSTIIQLLSRLLTYIWSISTLSTITKILSPSKDLSATLQTTGSPSAKSITSGTTSTAPTKGSPRSFPIFTSRPSLSQSKTAATRSSQQKAPILSHQKINLSTTIKTSFGLSLNVSKSIIKSASNAKDSNPTSVVQVQTLKWKKLLPFLWVRPTKSMRAAVRTLTGSSNPKKER